MPDDCRRRGAGCGLRVREACPPFSSHEPQSRIRLQYITCLTERLELMPDRLLPPERHSCSREASSRDGRRMTNPTERCRRGARPNCRSGWTEVFCLGRQPVWAGGTKKREPHRQEFSLLSSNLEWLTQLSDALAMSGDVLVEQSYDFRSRLSIPICYDFASYGGTVPSGLHDLFTQLPASCRLLRCVRASFPRCPG